MTSGERILIVGPSWVGDMMMAQSLFIQLKQDRPDCLIDVLAPEWSLPLLAHMPEVNDAIISPFQHGELALRGRYRLGRSLRDKRYTQAIILPNSLKSALVPFWAGIPKRTGYVGEFRYGLLNDARKLDRERLTKTVSRFVSLARSPEVDVHDYPRPHLETRVSEVKNTLEELHISSLKTEVLVLCPGAEYGPAKQWPAVHYAELANTYLDQGWVVWLLGSPRDAGVCQDINRKTYERCQDLAGKTSLGQVIDLMSMATVIVSNDSGLMHIAAAVDKPLVAIYGSSDPGFTPPLSDRCAILSLDLECSPCFKRECPLGHLDCLNKLDPQLAIDEVRMLLEKKSGD
jgi:heptosyltransferase-2